MHPDKGSRSVRKYVMIDSETTEKILICLLTTLDEPATFTAPLVIFIAHPIINVYKKA